MRHSFITFTFILIFNMPICLSAASVTSAPAPDPEKVLMIGDSFIYVYDIPKTLNELAAAGRKKAQFSQHVGGSKSLAWHWTNQVQSSTAPEAIAHEHWDLIILEEGNFPAPLETNLPAYVDEFKTVTRKYQTLAAKTKTPIMLFPGFIWVKSDQDIKNRMTFNTELADALGIVCAPTLHAILNSQKANPNLAVSDDQKDLKYATLKQGRHQSPYSAYLAACTIYAAMYDETPVGLKSFKSGGMDIDAADALLAQQVAWDTWKSYKADRKTPAKTSSGKK